MQKTTGDASCIQKFKPALGSALYKTQVDVVGKHISGLLLMKLMPDSSERILFSNEIGLKFFDFKFSRDSGFKVIYIIDQMNKKAVITTLRKDFELVLMHHTSTSDAYLLRKGQSYYYAFPQESGVNYYLTDSTCSRLVGMERSSNKKPVVEAVMANYRNGLPDTIGMTHKNFNFTIGLKRIENAGR
jgi:hypothetical protein